jgi:hypothetical protein
MSDIPPTLYCANHPKTETTLRCNRCEKPICSKCAIQTPTGYRCPECVHTQKKTFDTTEWYDYPIAFAVAGILSFIGSLIAANIGFFVLFIAPVAGVGIAEVTRLLIRRRRSKNLYKIFAVAVLIGSLPPLLVGIISAIMVISQMGSSGFGALFSLLWQGIYSFVVTTTAYYRLSGLVFKR